MFKEKTSKPSFLIFSTVSFSHRNWRNSFLLNIQTESQPRVGCDVDVRNLENMFLELKYFCDIWENIDKHEYEDKMKTLNDELKSGTICCLFFILLSHGDGKSVYLESCKQNHAECRVFKRNSRKLKRKRLYQFFRKTEATKDVAILLLMNSCRINKKTDTFDLPNDDNRDANADRRNMAAFHRDENILKFYSTADGESLV